MKRVDEEPPVQITPEIASALVRVYANIVIRFHKIVWKR